MRSQKARSGDAHHDGGIAVQSDPAADDGRVTVKAIAPQPIADDCRQAARDEAVVVLSEGPTKGDTNAQRVEVAARDQATVYRIVALVCAHRKALVADASGALDRARARAVIQVVGVAHVGLDEELAGTLNADGHEPLALHARRGRGQEVVNDGIDRGVAAHDQRNEEDGTRAESR